MHLMKFLHTIINSTFKTKTQFYLTGLNLSIKVVCFPTFTNHHTDWKRSKPTKQQSAPLEFPHRH